MVIGMILFGAFGFAIGAAIFYGKGRAAGFREGKALIPKALTDLIAEEQQEVAKEVIARWRSATGKRGK